MTEHDEATLSVLRSIRAKVAENGHMIAGVDAADGEPQFAYTIGLTPKYGFELAMNGAEVPDMHSALNQIVRRIRGSALRPVDKLLIEGIMERGLLLRLRPADPSWRFRWIAPTLELAGQPPVWQVQFPSRDGRWPGEPGFDCDPYVQLDWTLPRPDGA